MINPNVSDTEYYNNDNSKLKFIKKKIQDRFLFLFFLKERFKNLAAIKSTEWDEPKMLLKIILIYFKANIDEVCILFQLLTVFSFRFPVDLNVSSV